MNRFRGVDQDALRAPIDVPMCTRSCPCICCRLDRGELVVKPRTCGKTTEFLGRARS
ncbi:hypothetical protein [Sphingosinicella sp. CPCC 101087]|uniref:hypothetical protein n=1 Tax=Sphingosinicella sp. CPCC 101087 TaxID=2497754 RepID=UPI0013ED35E1|nr:hypothetical protein [Sphingosinicella sp. CPCC 101087]